MSAKKRKERKEARERRRSSHPAPVGRFRKPRADVPRECVAKLEKRLPRLVDLVCLRIDELSDAVRPRTGGMPRPPEEQARRMKELERVVRVTEKVHRFIVQTKQMELGGSATRPAADPGRAPAPLSRNAVAAVLGEPPAGGRLMESVARDLSLARDLAPGLKDRVSRAVAEVSRLGTLGASMPESAGSNGTPRKEGEPRS